MTIRKLIITMSSLFAACIILAGCSHDPCRKCLTQKLYPKQEKLVMLQKPINPILLRRYDICRLQKYGVQVIQTGQTFRLIFPSTNLFDNTTAEINDNYRPALAAAADFMRTYSKISVEVAAYSDPVEGDSMTKSGSFTDELTQRQADSVVRYLSKAHINARLIYGVGGGSRKMVAWSGSDVGNELNRRVEITFRYYHNNTAWY